MDIAGYTCLLLVFLLGPLPGPGGIPLLLTGLGLLSINNTWARKLLHYVREHSESLRDVLFPDKKIVQWAWDILVVLLIAGAAILDIKTTELIFRGVSIATYTIASTTLMFNRHRLRRLERFRFKRR